ncbi:MAG TPA: GNAT family N-acetyltransferase [Propionicimonas sp.]|nr:GNAT family N-acetyltransferase [Propionicimonas sp.]
MAIGVVLSEMTASDGGEALTVQRSAFVVEAQLYAEPSLPPLVETLDDLLAWLDGDAHLGFVARYDGRLVGSIRVEVDGDCLRLSRLSVAPDWQGRGLGAALLTQAERAAPAAEARLFTGHLSTGNLHLYRRLGYVEERRERVDDRVTLVHLRKQLAGVPTPRPMAG